MESRGMKLLNEFNDWMIMFPEYVHAHMMFICHVVTTNDHTFVLSGSLEGWLNNWQPAYHFQDWIV